MEDVKIVCVMSLVVMIIVSFVVEILCQGTVLKNIPNIILESRMIYVL
jgi:hypothetical protein